MKSLWILSLLMMLGACSHGHYKKYDLDGDGQVSKKEWTDAHDSKFSKKDKNGDGVLSADEIGAKAKSCCHKKCDDKKCSKKKCDGKSCSLKKQHDCKACDKKGCDGKSCSIKKKS